MPKVEAPQFPSLKVFLPDFGAVGNGVELCTDAFAKAIETLSARGGGYLIVPAGIWLTGPIVLKSNINLHIEKGAVILFSPDVELYPLVETVFEGLDTRRCQSPISGRNLTNVAITGQGAIDGNGHYWRPLKREKVTESVWKQTIARGGVYKRPTYWFPYPQTLKGDTISNMNVPQNLKTEEEWQSVRHFLRPVMVSLIECKNVWFQGVIFQNSPAWNLHPLMCENVLIEDIQVRNPSYAQNGDGLDLESCKNALIVNSTFDVGDDGICLKSGKDEDGRRRARACENVIVDGCTVYKGHGGFVVGSEMSGGVRNISVNNCQFLGNILVSIKGFTSPWLSTNVSTTSFQGQTLFREPSIKPVSTASVMLRKCTSAYDKIREKEVIPIQAPAPNTAITTTSSVFTASIMKKYLPNSTRMKLPEIPGRIMAQMAMAPHRKMKSRLEGVSAGVATVI